MFSRNRMWVGYHLRDWLRDCRGSCCTDNSFSPSHIMIKHHHWLLMLQQRCYYQFPICFELTSLPVLSFFLSLSYHGVMVSTSLWLALELVNLPHGQEKLKTCVWLFWFSIRKRIFPFSSLLEEETPNIFQCV